MYHFGHRFSVLIGPINHMRHLITKERLPFSIAYLSSLGLTLYLALGVRQSPKSICPRDRTNNPYPATLLFRLLGGRNCPGLCSRFIRTRIFSRRDPDVELWRSDGSPRCCHPIALLTPSVITSHLHSISLVVHVTTNLYDNTIRLIVLYLQANDLTNPS
jgi:Got1/Sft2-like family